MYHAGDQLDQAARVHELGTTVVLAPPGSALAASKSALLGKPATGTNPQGDPQVVRAAIARVTGIAELQQVNGGSSQDAQLYRAAAAAVAAVGCGCVVLCLCGRREGGVISHNCYAYAYAYA